MNTKLQDFRQFKNSVLVQPARTTLTLPAFTLPASTWAGASRILAEYTFGNNFWFSLRMPIDVFGANFVPAVRYVQNGFVTRYKLFGGLGELLYYPVYAGERLGPNAVLEVWSINSAGIPLLPEDEIFESSVLNFPADGCSACCDLPGANSTLAYQSPQIINPYANCNPFCLPLITN